MEVFVPPAPFRHQCSESDNKSTSYCVVLCCNLASLCVDIRVRDGSFVLPAPLRHQCCESGNSTVYLWDRTTFQYWKMCVPHYGKLCCRLASLCSDIALWHWQL